MSAYTNFIHLNIENIWRWHRKCSGDDFNERILQETMSERGPQNMITAFGLDETEARSVNVYI